MVDQGVRDRQDLLLQLKRAEAALGRMERTPQVASVLAGVGRLRDNVSDLPVTAGAITEGQRQARLADLDDLEHEVHDVAGDDFGWLAEILTALEMARLDLLPASTSD